MAIMATIDWVTILVAASVMLNAMILVTLRRDIQKRETAKRRAANAVVRSFKSVPVIPEVWKR